MNKTPTSVADKPNRDPNLERDRLIENHLRLAYKYAQKYQNRGLPLEDLRQEALLGLLEAARRFEPERGWNFSTYACPWIKKRLLAALAKEKRATAGTEQLGERDLPAPELVHRENLEASPDSFFPLSMPADERRVVLLSVNKGLPLKEVANRLGISVERVKQLRGKALRRLRNNSSVSLPASIRDKYGINTDFIRIDPVFIP
ncbi:MAG: sigma-70 family RNA polymerase sigma factor [Candidatus Cloacimonetes bacterium]|nr:sigma-70 family RNA polymerase sigma factor [Candidatus Cloacimonadota bacterium]